MLKFSLSLMVLYVFIFTHLTWLLSAQDFGPSLTLLDFALPLSLSSPNVLQKFLPAPSELTITNEVLETGQRNANPAPLASSGRSSFTLALRTGSADAIGSRHRKRLWVCSPGKFCTTRRAQRPGAWLASRLESGVVVLPHRWSRTPGAAQPALYSRGSGLWDFSATIFHTWCGSVRSSADSMWRPAWARASTPMTWVTFSFVRFPGTTFPGPQFGPGSIPFSPHYHRLQRALLSAFLSLNPFLPLFTAVSHPRAD